MKWWHFALMATVVPLLAYPLALGILYVMMWAVQSDVRLALACWVMGLLTGYMLGRPHKQSHENSIQEKP